MLILKGFHGGRCMVSNNENIVITLKFLKLIMLTKNLITFYRFQQHRR